NDPDVRLTRAGVREQVQEPSPQALDVQDIEVGGSGSRGCAHPADDALPHRTAFEPVGPSVYSPALPLHRHELRHRDGRRLFVYGELRGSLEAEDRESGAPAEAAEQAGLHKRLDRLSGAWIAISPARNVRPHLPRSAAPEEIIEPTTAAASTAMDAARGDEFDPSCPLCPGGPEVPFSYEAAV